MIKRGLYKKGAKKFALDAFVFSSTLAILLLASFVLADQLVYPSAGIGTNFTAVGQGVSQTYNITVNNTNIAGENITEVVIILNQTVQINKTDGTFNTSAGTPTLSSTNFTVNVSGINIQGGGNLAYIWFDAISDAPVKVGNFTLIMTANATIVQKNLSAVNINDTFTMVVAGDANVSGTNMSQNYVIAHENITGNETALTLNISFWNSTTRMNFTTTTIGNISNGNGVEINFSALSDGTDLPDGTYIIETEAYNTVGDHNYTNRTYILDTTAPSVSLLQNNGSTSTTKTQITIDITATDAAAGINSTCTADSSGATITGGTGSQTLVEDALNCGTTYTYTVTCVDTAGNSGVSSAYGAATLTCGGGDSGSGGGSGGSGSGGTTWSSTFVEDNQDLSAGGITRGLKAKERMRIKVSGETHHVGVKSISGDTATIEVASDPQEAQLSVGESESFDVSGDGYYDLIVTLNSIDAGEADVTVQYLHEKVQETTEEEPTDKGGLFGGFGGGDEGQGSSTGWLIGVIVVIIIIIIIAVVWMKKRK